MYTNYVIFALVLTCILESLTILLFFRKRILWIKYSLCCNVITNPLINVTFALLVRLLAIELFIPLTTLSIILLLIVLEILVFIIEAYLYKFLAREPLSVCLKISITTNLVSLLLGLAITPIALFLFI